MSDPEKEGMTRDEAAAINALKTSRDINDLRELVLKHGGSEINFGYNLARNRNAFDLTIGYNRYLFFQEDPVNFDFKEKFLRGKIPTFETIEYNADNSIEAIKVPYNTRPLDGMQFKEQAFTSSYLGAFEIMTAVGELLGKVHNSTQALPKDINLSDLVLVQGDKDLIRLLPPYNLDTDVTIDEVSQRILEELEQQDPVHPHKSQIEVLKQSYLDKVKHSK